MAEKNFQMKREKVLADLKTGKFFDGKENERFEKRTTEVLSDSQAVDFIESHPYYFSQRRPDLF